MQGDAGLRVGVGWGGVRWGWGKGGGAGWGGVDGVVHLQDAWKHKGLKRRTAHEGADACDAVEE